MTEWQNKKMLEGWMKGWKEQQSIKIYNNKI